MSTHRAPLLVSVAASFALCACAHVDVQLEHFIAADRGVTTATLAPGYAIENRTVRHQGEIIGITRAHHPTSKAVILFCGGDSFHRSLEGGEVLEALALDADVVLFDYPGYGETTGPISVDSILETAIATYDAVFSEEGAQDKKRILYGFSMGGLVAAKLAQERRADGLVLEATPPSIRRWASSRIPILLRPIIRANIEPQLAAIDTVAALEGFRGKILLFSSPSDAVVSARLVAEMENLLRKSGRDVALTQFADSAHGAIHLSAAFPAALRHFVGSVRALP